MVPKTLVLACRAPGRGRIGRLYLRELCMLYPRDRVCCFHMDPAGAKAASAEMAWLPMKYAPCPPERGWYGLGSRVRRASRPLVEAYVGLFKTPRLIEQAIQFGRQHRAEALWVPLHTPTTIRMARRVAQALGAPLYTTIWDDGEYVLKKIFGMDSLSCRRLVSEFARAQRYLSLIHI